MPHTRSAKKRLRQTKKRNLLNRELKKDIKIQIKKLFRSLKTGNTDEIKAEYSLCAKKLDKASAKQFIHRNATARRKSQLARLINAKLAAGSENS